MNPEGLKGHKVSIYMTLKTKQKMSIDSLKQKWLQFCN